MCLRRVAENNFHIHLCERTYRKLNTIACTMKKIWVFQVFIKKFPNTELNCLGLSKCSWKGWRWNACKTKFKQPILNFFAAFIMLKCVHVHSMLRGLQILRFSWNRWQPNAQHYCCWCFFAHIWLSCFIMWILQPKSKQLIFLGVFGYAEQEYHGLEW